MVFQWQFLKERVTSISKLKKFSKYVEPIRSYNTLNFESPAILLLKIEQIKNSEHHNFWLVRHILEIFSKINAKIWKKEKVTFLENDEFYIDVKFQLHCIKTEEVDWTWPELCKKSPACKQT